MMLKGKHWRTSHALGCILRVVTLARGCFLYPSFQQRCCTGGFWRTTISSKTLVHFHVCLTPLGPGRYGQAIRASFQVGFKVDPREHNPLLFGVYFDAYPHLTVLVFSGREEGEAWTLECELMTSMQWSQHPAGSCSRKLDRICKLHCSCITCFP